MSDLITEKLNKGFGIILRIWWNKWDFFILIKKEIVWVLGIKSAMY